MERDGEKACMSLWAKKSDKDGQFSWLPLMVHLQDTMDVADFLWNHWLSIGQREWIISQIQNGNDILAERLVRFLTGIHDIGKATPAFQTQRGFSSSPDLDEELLDKLEMAGFSGIRDFDVRFGRFTHHAIAGEVILQGMGINKGITSIIGAHHGKPIDTESECRNQIDAYSANYYQTENVSNVSKLWQSAHEYIFDWAINQSELYQKESIPELSKPAQVILSGIVIMADWIASNEHYFPLIPLEKTMIDNPSQRFQDGIRKWYFDQPLEVSDPTSSEKLYEGRFGFPPRIFQQVIFDSVENISDPGIIIIEAPMGCGKTEASLATAEQLAAKTGRSGLFFGLPTQATSNGMFPRVLEWLKGLSKEYNHKSSIQLKHGKAALNKLMNQLSSHIDEDAGAEGTVIADQWFAGRKTSSLDDFVVGTVDQFLLVSLKQKHLALRHLGFDRKVVIIDEVHAYDAYMQQYLIESVKWMGAYGVPVILLSATLPKEKRKELITAYLKGKSFKNREIDQSGANLDTDKYPLMTYSDGNRIMQVTDFPVQKDKAVRIRRLSDENLFPKVKDLISDGGVVGIIVNTVRRAQKIARECSKLFGENSVVLLHSNFIATDRVKKEDLLISLIGKGAKRSERLIVVGTQVIEQSLDIDFDVLITDLCPMDLLIQRIGRLQRHDIERPEKFKTAVTYVLGESDTLDFDRGSSAVYGEYLLARTQYFLPEEISIPSSVSTLVQKVYGFEDGDPNFSDELKKKYEDWKKKFLVKIDNKEQKAKVFRIDDPKKKIDTDRYNLIGWLYTSDNSDTDEKAYSQVRDTQETVEVIAVRKYGDKYGFFSAENQEEREVSDHIRDPEQAKKLATQTLGLPYYVIVSLGIDHLIEWLEDYNKNNLADWQKESWLKGSLGLIFDEKGTFLIGGSEIKLKYDYQYGLEVEREEES